MTAKDYCSQVCGAKCCKAHGNLIWPRACPALTKDNLCSQYERRFSVTFEALTSDGRKILCGCCKPETFIPTLPPEVQAQCCIAHPELLHQTSSIPPLHHSTTMPKTYSAYYEDTKEWIYKNRPHGNLVGELPLGSVRDPFDARNTIYAARHKEPDPFRFAVFKSQTGRPIIVSVDETKPPRRPHEHNTTSSQPPSQSAPDSETPAPAPTKLNSATVQLLHLAARLPCLARKMNLHTVPGETADEGLYLRLNPKSPWLTERPGSGELAFDPDKFHRCIGPWSTGERYCALFLLNVWNPGYAQQKRWRFDLFEFVGTCGGSSELRVVTDWMHKPIWP